MLIYTIDQIIEIEKAVYMLLKYAEEKKKAPLSRCYRSCEIILKNISICREDNWNDIDVLSKYIKEDWDEASKLHCGRYECDFFLHEYDLGGNVNGKIDKYIGKVDECIYKTISEDVKHPDVWIY